MVDCFSFCYKVATAEKCKNLFPLCITKLEENDIACCSKMSSEGSTFLWKVKIHTGFNFEMRFHFRSFNSNSQQQQK